MTLVDILFLMYIPLTAVVSIVMLWNVKENWDNGSPIYLFATFFVIVIWPLALVLLIYGKLRRFSDENARRKQFPR